MKDNHDEFLPVRPVEWDFDPVPDEELKACLVWELAHESETISKSTERFRWQQLAGPKRWDSKKMRYVSNSPTTRARARRQLKTIPDMDEQTMIGKGDASMRGSNFYSWVTTFGGTATKHWRELPNDLREKFLKDDTEWMLSPKCRAADLNELETLWLNYASELAALRANAKENDDSVDAHLFTTIIEPADTTFDDDTTTETPRRRLTAALTIDFHRFTDQEIIQAFGTWLKGVRPCRPPVKRGKKRNDDRAALDGLGIMRLLQWYRMTDDTFPSRFLRRGSRACYKLRQLAFEKFRQIFPFLPVDEKPYSWKTWPETEKMCRQIEQEMEALESAKRKR